jgi:bilirubin oxidase
MTLEQISKGVGGLIIVRDAQEANLNLPRKYGVDDFPIVLTSRRYNATTNQFVVQNVSYGDYMLTNGTPDAQVTLPKQMVRLRILNVEIERGYDLGFSDNRTFYIIGNDGGLLNAPVTATKVKLLVGERIEILVNLGADAIGSSFDLMAYNANQAFGFPGGEPATTGQFGSLLNNTNFKVLHINVGATTSNPITTVPTTLANHTYLTAADATINRTISITNGNPGGTPFNFDNASFAINTINKTVQLDAIEKWTVTNNNVFGHTFHIHDVEFKIVARNGSAANVGAHESGWKDVMYIPRSENVSFVAKFNDYADSLHPFMYHCHFSNHEDDGMMGQFVVVNNESTQIKEMQKAIDYSIYPSPSSDKIYLKLENSSTEVYYVTITNANGKTVMMLPQPEMYKGIDISSLSKGIYHVQLMDKKTKSISTKSFIKE